ncbi:MAG: hypothetical protein U1F70_01325 [Candidatus Competibacteraceae bacterium]
MSLVETVLDRMSSITKPQRTFLIMLFATLMYLPGKINFRNLSRYSDGCEKTYGRWFRRSFDFVEFNRSVYRVCSVVAVGWRSPSIAASARKVVNTLTVWTIFTTASTGARKKAWKSPRWR